MKKENNSKKNLSTPLKFISIILIISIVFLLTYVISGKIIKKSIINNLNPIIDKLSSTPGATDVEVKICAKPNSYSMPWKLEFHTFLTVNFSHLGQLGDEKILEILNNGKKLGKIAYSYDWEDLDYAIYTYSVSDSIFENTHPVFVTLTDGDKNYIIKKDNLLNKNFLYKGDAYKILSPETIHQITLILILSTIVFLSIFIFIIYKKAQKKKIMIVLIPIVFIALISCFVIKFIVIPTNKYNQAVALKSAGNDKEAYAIFDSLGNFKDAKNICNNYDYTEALTYLDNGHTKTAFYLLKNIQDYKDAKTKIEELLEEYPYLSILNATAGEKIIIGKYEQDNNLSNGTEDIEWIVLKNENGILYAVSKYILDAKVYNTHNGDGSTLKVWLKDDFHNAAFNEIPSGFISKVGLMTKDDMDVYYKIANAKPEWTVYAKAQKPEKHYYAGYSWWLDGNYFHGYGFADVDMEVVIESGSYSKNVSPVTGVNGVRPTIIIDYTSSEIDYYTSDYKDIENAGVTTRTEEDVKHITGSNSGKTRCTRCNGTGKVVLHYGNSWNKKEGYRYGEKCGKCGGKGYID